MQERTQHERYSTYLRKRYVPTDQDKELFSEIIHFVKLHAVSLVEAAQRIDEEYSVPAFRKRQAALKRQTVLRDGRFLDTRSATRKFDSSMHIDIPAMRHRDKKTGKLIPTVSLIKRHHAAFRAILIEDRSALFNLPKEQRFLVAAKRVLMAWLYLDPDRLSHGPRTEFRNIVSEVTFAACGYPSEVNRDVRLDLDHYGSFPLGEEFWIETASEALRVCRLIVLDKSPANRLLQDFASPMTAMEISRRLEKLRLCIYSDRAIRSAAERYGLQRNGGKYSAADIAVLIQKLSVSARAHKTRDSLKAYLGEK